MTSSKSRNKRVLQFETDEEMATWIESRGPNVSESLRRVVRHTMNDDAMGVFLPISKALQLKELVAALRNLTASLDVADKLGKKEEDSEGASTSESG